MEHKTHHWVSNLQPANVQPSTFQLTVVRILRIVPAHRFVLGRKSMIVILLCATAAALIALASRRQGRAVPVRVRVRTRR